MCVCSMYVCMDVCVYNICVLQYITPTCVVFVCNKTHACMLGGYKAVRRV